MKKTAVFVIIICLAALCVVGWMSLFGNSTSAAATYTSQVKQGDTWAAQGLYQRAILQYSSALEYEQSLTLYKKINSAYIKRYAEAPEDTLEDYMDFLDTAVLAYPADLELVLNYVEVYTYQKEYKKAFNCIKTAIESGNKDKTLKELFTQYRYMCVLDSKVYGSIGQCKDETFAVLDYDSWNIRSMDKGKLLTYDYDYVSLSNGDGICVVTGADSRIMGPENMVLGIFKEKVVHAGLMGDGLLPASFGDSYSYFDEFAVEKLSGYQTAGTFQNGKAAVEKDGKWMFIDTSGKTVSDTFQKICLDEGGMYAVDGKFLAQKNNQYGIYDSNLQCIVKLECSDVDVMTQDGLIAVCVGEQWGFVDLTGKVVIKPQYEKAKSFSNGLAAVCQNGLWGFIDPKGQVVIPCKFADAGYMTSDGVCPVRIQEEEPEEAVPVQNETVPETAEQTEPLQQESETQDTADTPIQEPAVEETVSETVPEQPAETWSILELILGIQEDIE